MGLVCDFQSTSWERNYYEFRPVINEKTVDEWVMEELL